MNTDPNAQSTTLPASAHTGDSAGPIAQAGSGTHVFASAYLADALYEFRRLKELAERAFAQTDDADFFALSGPESNSIAIIAKHLAGNLISRWTNFLTTDGEKPDRRRDTEFLIAEGEGRVQIMARWEEGWNVLFGTLESLRPEDLGRTITVRGEGHSAGQAIFRQVSHYAYHVGQIVLLAKEAKGAGWQSLSIPRGQSEAFANNPVRYRQ